MWLAGSWRTCWRASICSRACAIGAERSGRDAGAGGTSRCWRACSPRSGPAAHDGEQEGVGGGVHERAQFLEGPVGPGLADQARHGGGCQRPDRARAALGAGQNERVCTVSDSALAPQDRGGARRERTQRERSQSPPLLAILGRGVASMGATSNPSVALTPPSAAASSSPCLHRQMV